MKHYGDITKINGAEVPLVDVICGGSPCQDLSVAGLRKGLAGERSGLFMEQIRIVKEQRNECIRQLSMRGADIDVRLVKPRYLIWENVPGALSSGTPKGGDFRCVLEEICRIADKTATVPMPESGKWSTSGCIMGDGWSVAWRIHDAQFWGVPQRRRRIALVADFAGESAPEILFERKSVSGDIESGEQKGEEITRTTGKSTNKASNVFGDEIMPCLVARVETAVGNTQDGFNVVSFQERAGKPGGGKGILIQNEKTASLRTATNQSICCLNDQGGNQMSVSEEQTATLRAEEHGHQPIVSYGFEPGAAQRLNPEQRFNEEKAPTLRANMGDNQVGVACYGMDNERRRGPEEHDDQSPTITAKCGTGGNNVPVIIEEPILLESNQNHATIQTNGISTTLPASMGEGGGYVPMVTENTSTDVKTLGLDRASFNQGQNAQYDFSVEEELAQTLVSRGPGGGSNETVGALCARDYKGVGSQYVNEGKVIVQKNIPSPE